MFDGILRLSRQQTDISRNVYDFEKAMADLRPGMVIRYNKEIERVIAEDHLRSAAKINAHRAQSRDRNRAALAVRRYKRKGMWK